MNLILVSPADFIASTAATVKVRLTDRRFSHVRDVHRARVGGTLKVGAFGGLMGEGLITHLDETGIELELHLSVPPPPPLPMTLYLALPRPKFLARCLQVATTLGVKEIYLFNSYRVEKVYWSCAQLSPEEIRAACELGLEQARDTLLPNVHLKRLFKPFVEDELPALIQNTSALLAHPGSTTLCARGVDSHLSLAIGPEGGFIDYEIEKLIGIGFTSVRTLDRILKVETAIASLIGRLM